MVETSDNRVVNFDSRPPVSESKRGHRGISVGCRRHAEGTPFIVIGPNGNGSARRSLEEGRDFIPYNPPVYQNNEE